MPRKKLGLFERNTVQRVVNLLRKDATSFAYDLERFMNHWELSRSLGFSSHVWVNLTVNPWLGEVPPPPEELPKEVRQGIYVSRILPALSRTPPGPYTIVCSSLGELGFPEGASVELVQRRVREAGGICCPPEMIRYLSGLYVREEEKRSMILLSEPLSAVGGRQLFRLYRRGGRVCLGTRPYRGGKGRLRARDNLLFAHSQPGIFH